jgi:hypothetical protein
MQQQASGINGDIDLFALELVDKLASGQPVAGPLLHHSYFVEH